MAVRQEPGVVADVGAPLGCDGECRERLQGRRRHLRSSFVRLIWLAGELACAEASRVAVTASVSLPAAATIRR